jgi:hypothetical protein
VLSALYALGAPITSREATSEGVLVRAQLPEREVRKYAPFLVSGDHGAGAGAATGAAV